MPRVKLDAATVPALLQKGGWPAERLTADTWRSNFRGRSASFPVFVRVDREAGWVHFAIVPFLRSPEDEAGAHRLYTRLMQLNQQLLMAKFSIDDDLDVVLSVEYPLAEIDDNEFADALDVLSYYADRHHAELAPLGRPG
jgi:hypothetical protein